MAHQISNSHYLLALRAEFRPVVSNCRVVVDKPLTDQSTDGDGLQAFAITENINQGISRESLITGSRFPQVYYFLTAVVHTVLGVLLYSERICCVNSTLSDSNPGATSPFIQKHRCQIQQGLASGTFPDAFKT